MSTWKCRYAPSLGALEDTPLNIWGTEEYEFDKEPTVFFGLYGLPDFYTLWRHKGRRAILWAGSDILHFTRGYWLDAEGKVKVDPQAFAEWINQNCENYVENGVEHALLEQYGIQSKIVPSFLGNVNDYEIEYVYNERPQVYLSASEGRQREYGWEQVEMIADKCDVDFHLYGATWESKHSNVFCHGRVPKEVMNEQIKRMQCGLRLNEFDGFSEVLAKSILWGQHPISKIGYPFIESFTTNEDLIKKLNNLKNKTAPNVEGREYYLRQLNRYPWNAKI